MTAQRQLKLMPWGRYKGFAFEDLPQDYLQWLAEKAEDRGVVAAAERQLTLRRGEGVKA